MYFLLRWSTRVFDVVWLSNPHHFSCLAGSWVSLARDRYSEECFPFYRISLCISLIDDDDFVDVKWGFSQEMNKMKYPEIEGRACITFIRKTQYYKQLLGYTLHSPCTQFFLHNPLYPHLYPNKKYKLLWKMCRNICIRRVWY